MKLLCNLAVAFSLYSKIPMPRVDWKEENLQYALGFFPLVGAVIGAGLLLWQQVVSRLCFCALFGAAGFVLLPLLLSGGIHLDGLMDTADALSAWQNKERRLAILKDPHVGAFGAMACGLYLVAALGVWSEVGEKEVGLLAFSFVLSRALNGIGICTGPCAAGSSLARTFSSAAKAGRCKRILLGEIVACSGGMVCLYRLEGGVAVAVALVVFFLCRRMALRQFDGISGDLQGWMQQLCELCMALAVVVTAHVMAAVG